MTRVRSKGGKGEEQSNKRGDNSIKNRLRSAVTTVPTATVPVKRTLKTLLEARGVKLSQDDGTIDCTSTLTGHEDVITVKNKEASDAPVILFRAVCDETLQTRIVLETPEELINRIDRIPARPHQDDIHPNEDGGCETELSLLLSQNAISIPNEYSFSQGDEVLLASWELYAQSKRIAENRGRALILLQASKQREADRAHLIANNEAANARMASRPNVEDNRRQALVRLQASKQREADRDLANRDTANVRLKSRADIQENRRQALVRLQASKLRELEKRK